MTTGNGSAGVPGGGMPDIGGLGGLGGLGNIMGMVGKMQEMQARAEKEMAERSVEGSAGGGMVKVEMSGALELRGITIEKEVIDPESKEMLEDLVVAAVNQATKKAKELQTAVRAEHMKGLTGGLDIGGLDINKLLGGML